MKGPQYPPARAVSAQVEAHFARHLAAARAEGVEPLAAAPDAAAVEALIDAAFWASVRREEGYVPKISLAFLAPAQAQQPLAFERPLPLAAEALSRLAPAVERPGIHLGVWRGADGHAVWGMTRTIPAFCLVVEVAAPGLLVVKHRRRGEAGKFVNVAVLEGDQVKLLDERAGRAPECPSLLTSLLDFDARDAADAGNVPAALAVSMRQHGRGGLLLLVPHASQTWRESILQPVRYAVVPAFDELAELMRQGQADEAGSRRAEALRRTVEAIAGLTAVDGATLMTDRYELLAFGAKIGRRDGAARVERVVVSEPIAGNVPAGVDPAQLGGTRHLSAAQFVHDQRDAVALVASQDGRFTIFAWSARDAAVHAHRVETLLL